MNASSLSSGALAVVGMSCRLPGADGLAEFWELVRRGRTAWGPLPANRLNRDLYFDVEKGTVGKSYSDLGGLIPERPVDTKRCPIPDKWLKKCDIAHLIVCEVAADALCDAGYDPFALPRRDVGVFIGHTGGSQRVCDIVYATCIEDEVRWLKSVNSLKSLGQNSEEIAREIVRRVRAKYPKEEGDIPDLGGFMASSLVSRLFGLNGPHLVVDAACASSFQALSVGARALRQGRISMALVGGASYCKSDSLVLFSQAQSVSSTGSCPFSASADGLITAEGYVIFAMKTLERAIADGDRIHVIIRGIGVASDGKGKSLWAPRKEGQILAVHRAYGRDVEVSRLQYIEAHATSTQVGDATELSALSEALTGRLPPGVKLPIGSVKGNIGHTLETAGVAGMLKTILAMKHGIVPPAVQRGDLNTTIEWKDCPFYVPFREEPWPESKDGHPRRAAVNAFGIGGLNVHVVMDEFQPQKSTVSAPVTGSPLAQQADDDLAIAVVGAGCIFPGAFTVDAFWKLLISASDPKIEAPVERWASDVAYSPGEYRSYHTYNRLGGFIDGYAYDWRRHKVPPKQVAQANPLQFMLLDAADQAFHDSGYHEKKLDRTRVGVVVGSMFGGDFSNQLQLGIRLPEFNETLADVLRSRGIAAADVDRVVDEFRKRLMEKMPALVDETGSFTSSTLASRITKTFNLMGGALAIDSGGCSSLAALQASVDILREQSCDMVVCAAGQRAMDLMTYEALAESGSLSSGTPHGAFDVNADGVVPGEGCGVLLLKRLADARRDGDRIRAVIRGVAASHGADEKNMDALANAMQAALEESRVAAEHVTGLEPIGYGIPRFDRDEILLIDEVYGDQRPQPLQIGGLRAQIGDTGAASGMAAVLKATLSLENKVLPSTLHLTEPVSQLNPQGNGLRPTMDNTSIPAVNEAGYRAIGVSSLHGRLAYHLIIDNGLPKPALPVKQSQAAPAAAEKVSPRVDVATNADATPAASIFTFRASVPDWRSLESVLADVAARPEAAMSATTRFQSTDRIRCAIIADSSANLAKRAKFAVEALRHGTGADALLEQGVICVECGKPRQRVAVLLPGQGSQFPGMLRDVCQHWPAAAKALQQFDETLVELGMEKFESLAWTDGEGLGKDIWRTQASMLIADSIAWEVLTAAGLRPDYIAAHSFGEFPALFAAGAWSFREAAMATRARCAAVSASQAARGTMLSVFAPLRDVDRLLSSYSGQLWISAENGPEQIVVGGLSDEAERFGELLRKSGIKFKTLAVPCPFHTPLLGDAQPHLRRSLAEREIVPPQIPMISSTSARFVVEPDEIRASLVKQFTEPVHFRRVVDRLYELGVRVFVEAGPSQVLTHLAKRILSDRDDVAFASFDHSNRSGIEQLSRLLAFLEARNLLEVEPLERRPNEVVIPVPTAIHFDATEKRRHRKRTQASAAVGDRVTSVAELARTPSPPRRSENGPQTTRTSESEVATPPARASMAAVTKSREGSHLGNGSGGNGSNGESQERISTGAGSSRMPQLIPSVREALQDYLVRFVVDQTGYPPEIVEIDADLEADLGIDSIKKAQLFGELGEEFSLQAAEDLSLDDFPTLKHVLDYLIEQPSVLTSRRFTSSNPDDTQVLSAVKASATVEPVDVASAPVALRSNDGGHRGGSSTADTELESSIDNMLVQFVVDQTGYPSDIVDLDADLEADLGIDSIKKAQLFGEIGERFNLQPDENLSLDDFPTLRHVRNYLLAQPNVRNDRQMVSSATVSAHERAPNLDEQTSSELPSTQESNRSSAAEDDWDLQGILVNFVVEQTGYPPEIVDMDVDLESDLGIDSIKKAQLFGEIGEQFRLVPDENLSLDDFPTLRHVLVYLKSALEDRKNPDPAPVAAHGASSWTQTSAFESDNGDGRDASSTTRGSTPSSPAAQPAFDIGFESGRKLKSEIARVIQWMATQDATNEVACGIPTMETLSTYEAAELRGIAEGSQIAPETILAWSHVVADSLSPAVSLWHTSEQNLGLVISWSHPVEASVRARQVLGRHSCLVMSAPGTVGAVAGVNDCGVCAMWMANPASRSTKGTPRLPGTMLCLRVLEESADLKSAAELASRSNDVAGGSLIISQQGLEKVVRVDFSPGKSPQVHTLADAFISQPRIFLRGDRPEPLGINKGESHAAQLSQIDAMLARENKTNASVRSSRWSMAVVLEPSRVSAYVGTERSGLPVPARGWRPVDATIPLGAPATADVSQVADSPAPNSVAQPEISFDYETNSITHRYVLRMKPLPAAPTAKMEDLAGPVLVVGAESHALRLADRLKQAGANATVFPTQGPLDETLRRFETIVQAGLPGHVIVATGLGTIGAARSADEWTRNRDERLLAPFWVLQRWVTLLGQAKRLGQARLSAITALGGDFGLSGRVSAVDGGGLAGLLKGIRNEHPELTVKIIDIDDPSVLASAELINELASRDGETEVGLGASGRQTIRPAIQRASELSRGEAPRPGDVWVVTGGARGVTAVVARELARTFGVHLHVLGTTVSGAINPDWLKLDAEGLKRLRSEVMVRVRQEGGDAISGWRKVEKAIELHRNLQEFSAAGVTAVYHSCDVADWNSLSNTLEQIRRQSGPIRGILHGAGFEAAAKFERKKPDPVRTTLSVKVGGAAALIALTQDDPVSFFIGFGSTSGRYGGIGQTDYSLANELLAKQLGQLREIRPRCRATTFHWHAWGEVGMAARPESKFALEGFGLHFMPTREGVGHVLSELAAGLPESEILITEPKLCPECVPADSLWRHSKNVNSAPVSTLQSSTAAPPVVSSADRPPAATAEANKSAINLEDFLVNFVVEQTGYPPEIVELDADLEADLGIDSIKKAQLFGEIGETFQVQADEDLSLDDFPTLRHVMNYLQNQPGIRGNVAAPNLEEKSAQSWIEPARTPAPTPTATRETPAPSGTPFPLLNSTSTDSQGRPVSHLSLDPARDVFLQEHRLFGQPFLPAVVALEILVEGVLASVPGQDFLGLSDVEIHNGLRFLNQQPVPCRVHVEPRAEGARARMVCDFVDRSGRVIDRDRPLVSANVLLGTRTELSVPAFVEPPFGDYPFYYIDSAPMYHGEKFRTLKGLLLQHDGGFGELKMPSLDELAGWRKGLGWQTPSALLDGCLVACAVFQFLMFAKRVDIPQGFDQIRFARVPNPGEVCRLQYSYRRRDERNSWYDFSLFDENRRPVLFAEGFRCVSVNGDGGGR